MLALSEINVLYECGLFSHGMSVIFLCVIAAAAVVCLVCYVLYYNLGNKAGYIDRMIPLLLAAVITAGICIRMWGNL